MKALRLSLQALLLGLVLLTQPVRAEVPAQLSPDLLAVVWQQTSAEYKALCMQIFHGATEAMRTHVQGGEYLFQDGRLWLQTLVRHPDGRLTGTGGPWRWSWTSTRRFWTTAASRPGPSRPDRPTTPRTGGIG